MIVSPRSSRRIFSQGPRKFLPACAVAGDILDGTRLSYAYYSGKSVSRVLRSPDFSFPGQHRFHKFPHQDHPTASPLSLLPQINMSVFATPSLSAPVWDQTHHLL